MEDTEASALFQALMALAITLDLKGVMDASDYLIRVGAIAEGANAAGKPTIARSLKEHAVNTAGFLATLKSGAKPPSH